ncbi:MAG: MFS transporter [Acidobacteria bacterium]|nr:MFS transporter [Acidobacteriota bacterium]
MHIHQTAVAADRGVEALPERAVRATRTRWWMLSFFSLLHLICFLDRGIIAVAQPEIRETFGLTLGQMGVVLAAFTWTYALGQIPVGWLGDRYGPKRVLSVLITWTSASACLTGVATGFGSLLVVRLLLGLGEAGAFPVAGRGTQLWFSPAERARAQAIVHFSGLFAVAIMPLAAGALLVAYGWRVMFAVFGVIGFGWVAAFGWFYRDHPEDHPLVNRAELGAIRGVNEDGSIRALGRSQPRTPWRDSDVAEYVVPRARLWLSLLRHHLLPDVVSDVRARISRTVGGRARHPGIDSALCGHGGHRPGRIGVRPAAEDSRPREPCPAPRGRRGVHDGRRVPDSRRAHPRRHGLDSLPGGLVLLPRLDRRPRVGRGARCRRRLQRDGHRCDEHVRVARRVGDADRVRHALRPGPLGRPVPGQHGDLRRWSARLAGAARP